MAILVMTIKTIQQCCTEMIYRIHSKNIMHKCQNIGYYGGQKKLAHSVCVRRNSIASDAKPMLLVHAVYGLIRKHTEYRNLQN